MKKIQYFGLHSRTIKKNNEFRYIANFLVECSNPEQYIMVSSIDEDGNKIEYILQENNIYCTLDYTDFMTICNPTGKRMKKIKYSVFSIPCPDTNDFDLETSGTFTLLG